MSPKSFLHNWHKDDTLVWPITFLVLFFVSFSSVEAPQKEMRSNTTFLLFFFFFLLLLLLLHRSMYG